MVGSEKILCLAAQLEQPLRCIHYDAKQAQVSKRLPPEVVSCGSPNQLLLSSEIISVSTKSAPLQAGV